MCVGQGYYVGIYSVLEEWWFLFLHKFVYFCALL